ncbi:MAG: 23S rRNA (pseudouridine(1915)-N(3))-methyltransferase RlmH [Clostridia bacterium]|nr:23S rRNA (pseudouridine(1915)-N(3))-methyltransferase RlmH [Clostridia bacterium]
MNIKIIAVGKIKEKYFTAAVDEYSKRMSRFAKFEIIEVPDEKIPDNASEKEQESVKEKEGNAILSKLKPGDTVIAMCIEGSEMSSEKIASKIEQISLSSSSIAFIIGGSLGLHDSVKARADLRLSFGPVTLPHQLMRVVLCEQIYRAFKINHNESYHK